jgi:hypothetical protein
MRRLGTGVWTVTLLGVAASTAGAQEVVTDGKEGTPAQFAGDRPGHSTWGNLWGNDKAKSAVADHGGPAPPPGPPVAETARRVQQREKNAFTRRQAVCDRLIQIAEATGDIELQRQANELLERAWSIYLRRTAGLHLGGADEAALEQNLETGTAMPRPRAEAPNGNGRAELMGRERP